MNTILNKNSNFPTHLIYHFHYNLVAFTYSINIYHILCKIRRREGMRTVYQRRGIIFQNLGQPMVLFQILNALKYKFYVFLMLQQTRSNVLYTNNVVVLTQVQVFGLLSRTSRKSSLLQVMNKRTFYQLLIHLIYQRQKKLCQRPRIEFISKGGIPKNFSTFKDDHHCNIVLLCNEYHKYSLKFVSYREIQILLYYRLRSQAIY